MDQALVTDSPAGSTPVAGSVTVPADEAPFDPGVGWRKSRSVALRPEPFGALVYHFGNRKLSFLKSMPLVAVVKALEEHPDVPSTLAACDVPASQHRAYVTALATLARSQMIERRPEESA
ncbi:mycofactocin biosynthesis chaperone MftB [Modestobacter versicolor]|uniref:Mycofactocin biosynthesis chaperone MftB n=1 Tax=Modestobacter versicolor TaxID=429133 RepID=A0A323VCQ0_9ACTN|nr:mycofactocin biosynthesis chaperone MftB [Modestobacter versicolor]PZA20996.1 mycofactocin biosynthesis chaperone MftB [Modestobacter versicolor]